MPRPYLKQSFRHQGMKDWRFAGLIDSDGYHSHEHSNHLYTVSQSGDRGRAMIDQLARLAAECGINTRDST